MGVVNDGHEHLAGTMDAEGFVDEQAFAAMIVALELDLERLAEDAQRVVISVQRAVGRVFLRHCPTAGLGPERFSKRGDGAHGTSPILGS